jgi:hypothetical protein
MPVGTAAIACPVAGREATDVMQWEGEGKGTGALWHTIGQGEAEQNRRATSEHWEPGGAMRTPCSSSLFVCACACLLCVPRSRPCAALLCSALCLLALLPVALFCSVAARLSARPASTDTCTAKQAHSTTDHKTETNGDNM